VFAGRLVAARAIVERRLDLSLVTIAAKRLLVIAFKLDRVYKSSGHHRSRPHLAMAGAICAKARIVGPVCDRPVAVRARFIGQDAVLGDKAGL
jgi:hypothetical protein